MNVRGGLKKALLATPLVGLAAAALLAVQAFGPARLEEPKVQGALPEMRQLSQTQYLESIAAIFGKDIVAKVRFAPIYRTDGLTAIGARTAMMTLGALEPIEESGRAVAEQVTSPEHRNLLISCQPKAIDARDEKCARDFLGKAGRLLYRRPLTETELDREVQTAGAAIGPAGDFYYGLSMALSRMLVSRHFLYIKESVEPDPAQKSAYRLDGYSKASRLSFFLWNAAPDSALLAAAEAGELHTRKGLDRQVERMLASPRLEQGVRGFFTDMLVLEGFDILAKDPIIYPAFTSKVVNEAREQLLRTIVDHLIRQNGDYRDLMTTRETFMTRDLAAVYRLPVNAAPEEWVSYKFPESDPRSGLLTQIGFLAKYSHPGKTSPTQRGRGLRETLLCQRVPDPPPNVDFSLLTESSEKLHTAREKLDAHRSHPVCAGCHKLTDPIGLVLENFDGAGQYRVNENGVTIDSSGAFDGVNVKDAADLGRALRESPALTSCFVSRIYSYGAGRKLEPADKEFSEYLQASFENGNYRLLDFLRTITTSNAFYAVKMPTSAEAPSTHEGKKG